MDMTLHGPQPTDPRTDWAVVAGDGADAAFSGRIRLYTVEL